MARSNFLDANVWVALIWDRHVHSRVARQWFVESSEEDLFFCRLTQLTVLRLLTTGAVMGSDTQNMSGAWRLWDQATADDRIALIDEPAGLERVFRSYSKLSSHSPKVWADAYLLAFAASAGLRLVTFDRSLQSRGSVLVL